MQFNKYFLINATTSEYKHSRKALIKLFFCVSLHISETEVFLVGCWRLGKVLCQSNLRAFFFLSSHRKYYNDLQRHAESKLCCKRLSLGSTKNHREKMQKVWNSQQQRLTGKYGVVFLWVKVTFMLCFPMRNYKLSKEF